MNRRHVFNVLGIAIVMGMLLYFVLHAGFEHGYY